MKQKISLPRIIKIEHAKGHQIKCMFNNGESRLLDFDKFFKQWNVSQGDLEFPLLEENEFLKVVLRNFTLSWPNIEISVTGENGNIIILPYEIGADTLFQLSERNTKSGLPLPINTFATKQNQNNI